MNNINEVFEVSKRMQFILLKCVTLVCMQRFIDESINSIVPYNFDKSKPSKVFQSELEGVKAKIIKSYQNNKITLFQVVNICREIMNYYDLYNT